MAALEAPFLEPDSPSQTPSRHAGRPCTMAASVSIFVCVGASMLLLHSATDKLPIHAFSAGKHAAAQGLLEVGDMSVSALISRKAALEAELESINTELGARAHDNAVAEDEINQGSSRGVMQLDTVLDVVKNTVKLKPNVFAGSAVFLVVLVFVAMSTYGLRVKADHIPPCSNKLDRPSLWLHHEVLQRFVDKNLKAECFADLSCLGLLINKPWRTKPGNPVKSDKFKSNSDWMKDGMQQSGVFLMREEEEDSGHMWRNVFAFWAFLFKKKKPYKCMFLMVVEGILTPLTAQVFGWIVGEMSGDGDENKLITYCVLLLVINIAFNRAEYVYEVDVPGASVRYELTYRLQRQFLGMSGKTAEAWPPGRCAAMLQYDIIQAVNLNWESIFAITKCITSLIVSTAIMLQNTQAAEPRVRGACIVIFATLFVGTLALAAIRQPNCLDLASRKRDWQLCWTAICSRQVREHRDGECINADEAAQEVSDAAMVFRKRAFHYYFIRLVAGLVSTEMVFFCEAVVAFVAGMSAIKGDITVGEGAALIGVVKLLAGTLTSWTTITLNIIEGYSSLMEICDVFNEEVDNEPTRSAPPVVEFQSTGLRSVDQQQQAERMVGQLDNALRVFRKLEKYIDE